MMHFVNRRSDDDRAESAIQPGRKRDIGVMRLNYSKHQGFVNQQFGQLQSKQQDHRGSQEGGQHDFAEMKPVSGGHIHFRIGMMGAMESPKEREPMVHAVPPVHPEVEE